MHQRRKALGLWQMIEVVGVLAQIDESSVARLHFPRFGLPFGKGNVIQKKQVAKRNDNQQAESRRKPSLLQNLPVRDDQQWKEERQNEDQVSWSE
jgi:hypothetical protein